jgi:glycyl-tRNA synthetase
MSSALSFQDIILRLHHYWADHGCFIWQPYNVQVGAGTMNPATVLRVMGPEPWNVGYVEPSVRPDDSRYGENPNRFQQHIQYQVILKPDPGNPQDLYLGSLAAIGIKREEHDIRFVEDNWEWPAFGAWGLGWEVWLDGLEITQFTYFQQAGGIALEPVSVELTYGLERIAMFLQGVDHFKEIEYAPGIPYGEMYGVAEYEHSRYNLDEAGVEAQAEMFRLYEAEARRCLGLGLVLPAHDFVLKCSHTFNILDARGAIGVTERAKYFARMRELARQVSKLFLEQRQKLGYPLLSGGMTSASSPVWPGPSEQDGADEPRLFVLEIGTEELPPGDILAAIDQLRSSVPELLQGLRIAHGLIRVYGSPRRLTVLVHELAHRQSDEEELLKGPPADAAFDKTGEPTKAAHGFARRQGVRTSDLIVREADGGRYVYAHVRRPGRSSIGVLGELLPELIAGISFPKGMRWNASGVAFSRPIRWLASLLGDQVVPFAYAGLTSGNSTRGLRPDGSPEIELPAAESYRNALENANIVLDQDERRDAISQQIHTLASEVGGRVPDDPALLEEVTHLVEYPTALLGSFDNQYLNLPRDLLIMVMRKHQRYFPVVKGDETQILPYFITVRNGGRAHLDTVRHGNEEVIRARFSDAEFFWKADTKTKLEDFLPRLDTLTFQDQLGSMLDKTKRLERLTPELASIIGLDESETATALRAARLCKADLVTQMVTDFTALQGIMGREYAILSGETEEVALAIFEHYLPRYAGDQTPSSRPGLVVGLANRLDSLAGLFSVGLAPSGSADPYHLRRDALGLVHNLIAHRQPFSIQRGLALAEQGLPVEIDADTNSQTAAFVRERLRGVLRDDGFAFDVVDAVLSDLRGDDPFRARVAVEQLAGWVTRNNWLQILAAYSRCARILRALPAEVLRDAQPLSSQFFVEPESRALYEVFRSAATRITADSSVDEFFEAFLLLVEPINVFFDKVLVMAEDIDLRAVRLALLRGIVELAQGIVNLSKLQGF